MASNIVSQMVHTSYVEAPWRGFHVCKSLGCPKKLQSLIGRAAKRSEGFICSRVWDSNSSHVSAVSMKPLSLPRTRRLSHGQRGPSWLVSSRVADTDFPSFNSVSVEEVKELSFSLNPPLAEGNVTADVTIIGAGVIGLFVAHQILHSTSLSVALIDGAFPTAGATGAGQGYIWLGHRQPGTAGWDLAKWSKQQWEELVFGKGGAPAADEDARRAHEEFGWQATGSLIVGTSQEQAASIQTRVLALNAAGVEAHFVSAAEAMAMEPSLHLPSEGAALFVPGDAQMDARLTISKLLKNCREFASTGRYMEMFNEPVEEFLRDPEEGRVCGVRTIYREVHATRGVVIATGAWTTGLMKSAWSSHSELPAEGALSLPVIRPRKGFLIELPLSVEVSLTRALMEFEYTANYSAAPSAVTQIKSTGTEPAVSFTATVGPSGNLLLGSSREFSGYDKSVSMKTISRIIARASVFLPGLSSLLDRLESDETAVQQIRTGLRPFAEGSRPFIGPLPSQPGVILAAGHEGSGLCMAPGTAEIVLSHLLGRPCLLDAAGAFSPVNRLVQNVPVL